MAKSRDEEPRSEEAVSDPSAPVDPTTRGAVERGPASSAAPASSPPVAAHPRSPDAYGASSASIANPMADPPSSNPAFPEIVQDHRSYLLGLAVRLSGRREVAELVQDTFQRARRRFGELRPDSPIRAWLAAILTRRFLDHNKHDHAVEGAMAQRSPAHDIASDPIPPEISHAALREAIEQLEPELREIIECHLADRSYKQIAAELRIPIGTVSSRMKRARLRLKELFTPTGVLK